jgi:hypothetical protein
MLDICCGYFDAPNVVIISAGVGVLVTVIIKEGGVVPLAFAELVFGSPSAWKLSSRDTETSLLRLNC